MMLVFLTNCRSFASLSNLASEVNIHVASSRYSKEFSLGESLSHAKCLILSSTLIHGLNVSLFCRQRVAAALMDTILSLNIFEKGVKDCLEI